MRTSSLYILPLLLFGLTTGRATGQTVRFRLDTIVTQAAPSPTSEVLISFKVDNFTNIRAISGTLLFDPAVVEYLGVANVALPSPGNLLIGYPTATSFVDRITFSWFAGAGATFPFGATIFRMRFRVLGPINSQTAFTFSDVPTKLEAVIASPITKVIPDVAPGLLQIAGVRIYGDTLSGAPASQMVALFRTEGYNSLASGQGAISWDPTVLSFVNTEQYGLPSISSGSFGLTEVANGELSFSYFGLNGESLPDQSILFGIRFDLIGGPGDISAVTMKDGVLIPSAFIEFIQESGMLLYPVNMILDPGRMEIAASAGVRLSPKVFLQGPYAGMGLMNANLRLQPAFPLTDPYSGTQTTTSALLNAAGQEVVDWVLIQLRDAVTPSSVVASRPGLLRKDGTVIGADGAALLFPGTPVGSYRIAIRHRNHLGAMSLNPFALSATPLPVDFTDGSIPTFGVQAQRLSAGVLQLWGGDADGNGAVQNSDDVLFWVPTVGANGYLPADYDLSGVVQNTDRLLIWSPNSGKTAQLP